MREIDIARAWKDADYRASLTEEELAALPTSPIGNLDLELTDDELALIAGGEESGEVGVSTVPSPPPGGGRIRTVIEVIFITTLAVTPVFPCQSAQCHSNDKALHTCNIDNNGVCHPSPPRPEGGEVL
jgi:mersacidin/lichenicidin family type 2 lantibiotic